MIHRAVKISFRRLWVIISILINSFYQSNNDYTNVINYVFDFFET